MKKVILPLLLFSLYSCQSTQWFHVKLYDNGSESFNGKIVKYKWRQIEGKTYKIQNENAAITTTTVKEGDYAWELTVTDNDGLEGKDTTGINPTKPQPNGKRPEGKYKQRPLGVQQSFKPHSGKDFDIFDGRTFYIVLDDNHKKIR